MAKGALLGALLAGLASVVPTLASYQDNDLSSALPGAATAAPGISACGNSVIVNGVTTPATDAGASNFAGTVIEGQAAVGCTLTWAKPRKAAPRCVVSSPTGLSISGYTPSAAGIAFTHLSVANAQITWICIGD